MAGIDFFLPDADTMLSSSVLSAYVEAYTNAGDWVVDPFCQSSSLVEVAVALGRSVVAVNANPLDILRVRTALAPARAQDLNVAVTRLADSPKSGVTLRQHLVHLYRTLCPMCAGEATADYFVWERGGQAPVQVSYHCASCGASGMRNCDAADAETANQVPARGLHYWHLMDRAAKAQSESRTLVEELLDLYTPRNLYALSNLLLKVDGVGSDSPVKEALQAILLESLDQGTKLQCVPGEPDSSPTAHLQPPDRFAEWNVWHLLESAAQRMSSRQGSSLSLDADLRQVLLQQDIAGAPRAFVEYMSVKALAQALGGQRVRLVMGQPPVPSKLQWALPYLWTAFLYGHAAAGALWALLEKRTSYWWWYANALRAMLQVVRPILRLDGRIVLAGAHKDIGFHEALALAATGADLRTESVLQHLPALPSPARPFASTSGDYRLLLTSSAAGPRWSIETDEVLRRLGEVAVEAAYQVLEQLAEPMPFARLHCGIWQALAQRGVLQRVVDLTDTPASPLELAREGVRTALQKQVGIIFIQLWADPKKERCLWWLKNPPSTAQPLSERVEDAVYDILLSRASQTTGAVLQEIYRRFPGGLTPDAAWVEACLRSYGAQSEEGTWALNAEDGPEQRATKRAEMIRVLVDIGQRLALQVWQGSEGMDVGWTAEDGSQYVFAVLQSAALSPLTRPTATRNTQRRYGVVARMRQELVRTRLSFSPALGEDLVRQGWQLMAQSSVEQWQARPEIKLSDIEYLVIQDLLDAYSRPHLPLL